MGERRMLTRKVTDNDNFVELPATAQALYLHLTMNADDDGFCSQISTAMFRAHAKKKDLEALVDKKYLIRFQSGVMVIKHWRMANALRKDRHEPTVYQEEAKLLTVKQNGAYTLAANWQPNGNQPLPQDKLSKDNLNQVNNKNNINNNLSSAHAREAEPDEDDGFDAFWEAYPRKSGDIRQVYFEYLGVIQNGVKPETLLEAVKWQAEEKGQYMPNADKWLRNKGWTEKKSDAKPAKQTKFSMAFDDVTEADYDFEDKL